MVWNKCKHWHYVALNLFLSTNSSFPNKVTTAIQVRNETLLKPAFAAAHTTEPFWNKIFLAFCDLSLSCSKLEGPLHQEKLEYTSYHWRLVSFPPLFSLHYFCCLGHTLQCSEPTRKSLPTVFGIMPCSQSLVSYIQSCSLAHSIFFSLFPYLLNIVIV